MSVQARPGRDVERFTAGKVEQRKLAVERIAASLLGALTVGLVLPLVAILGSAGRQGVAGAVVGVPDPEPARAT